MIPSLALLSPNPDRLVSTEVKRLSEESLDAKGKQQRVARRVELEIAGTSERLTNTSGHAILNLGCVSAAEMIVAKVTLDALVAQARAPSDSSAYMKSLLKSRIHVYPIVEAIRPLKQQMDAGGASNDLTRLQKLWSVIGERRLGANDSYGGKAYRDFLREYIEKRDITEDELVREAIAVPSDNDDGEPPYDVSYYEGVNDVLAEYYQRNPKYANGREWTTVVRAFARSEHGERVCVGIVNLGNANETDLLSSNLVLKDVFRGRKAMRMQGIVGCPIYRMFNHAPIGNAVLDYVENIATKTNSVVVVSPHVSNEQWI